MLLQKKDLLKVMQLLKPGLAKKDIIEQFTHYVFTGKEVITFNDEICISHPFETDFRCSARAEELFKTVNGVREDTLDITVNDNTMDIKSSKTRASLAISTDKDAEQLIGMLKLEEAVKDMLPLPEDFVRGMFLCMFSASKDMTKGRYTCVYISDNMLYSTDGVRISKYQLKEGLGAATLIPARNVEELVKFPVTHYSLSDSWCHFGTNDGVVFSSRIMEGELPSVDEYFNIEGKRVRLPQELRDLVSSVSFMTEGKVETDKMIELLVDKDKILCKGQKKDIGWVEREIDFEYAQEGFKVVINPSFLSEVLTKATIMRVTKQAAMFTSASFQHLISLR